MSTADQIPVTTVTQQAEVDDLTEQDYREIYEELRQGVSLRDFVEVIESAFSFATWNKYEKGNLVLNRQMQNELRIAIGQQRRPLTIIEAMHNVDPNAKVWQVGDDETAIQVVKVATSRTVAFTLNGNLVATYAAESPVTTVTTAHKRRKPRPPRHRLSVSVDNYKWLQDQGISADEAIAKLRGMS